jgi:hypothetical protein
MQLLQSAISQNDLKALATYVLYLFTLGHNLFIFNSGCIFEAHQPEKLNVHLLQALCDSYQACNKFAENTKQNLFHLRDFVYLLRYLRKKCSSDGKFVLKASDLLRGLQRNFNGIASADFAELVKMFFTNVNLKLRSHQEQEWKIPTNLETDTFIELIQDRQVQGDGTMPKLTFP